MKPKDAHRAATLAATRVSRKRSTMSVQIQKQLSKILERMIGWYIMSTILVSVFVFVDRLRYWVRLSETPYPSIIEIGIGIVFGLNISMRWRKDTGG